MIDIPQNSKSTELFLVLCFFIRKKLYHLLYLDARETFLCAL